jgi:hypothetical protein
MQPVPKKPIGASSGSQLTYYNAQKQSDQEINIEPLVCLTNYIQYKMWERLLSVINSFTCKTDRGCPVENRRDASRSRSHNQ